MTEKNYNLEQMARKSMNKQEKVQKAVGHEPAKEESRQHVHEAQKTEKAEEKKEEKKHAHGKPKKTEAFVNAVDVPLSTKQSAAICRFIKRRKIADAIADLEQVAKLRKPVPMRGEIPHRHGQIMAGRFPQKAAKEFIILLKSLNANALYVGVENPVIAEARANIGARPFGRYGIRKKRTHITLVAKTIGGKNGK